MLEEVPKKIFDSVHSYRGQPFHSPFFQDVSVISLFEKNVIKYPERPFITEILEGKGPKTYTYQEVYEQVMVKASYLQKQLQIEPRQRIAILPQNSLLSISTILAVLSLNAVAVIINSQEPLKRIREQVNSTECTLIISEDVISLDHPVILMSEIGEGTKELKNKPFLYSDPAIVMFTTGTTSTSKAIEQMHYSIVVNCMALAYQHQLNANTTLLCTLPIYYANGLEFTIFSTMISGAHVFVLKEFDPFTYLRMIEKYQIQIASLVPSMLQVIANASQQADLSSLSYFVSAAAPLDRTTSELVWKKFGKRIIQGYGLTETTNFSTLLPTSLSKESYRKWMIDCEIPTVGIEVFGNEVQILSPSGEILPFGMEGEICMRGHNVMAGYLNNSQANKEAFKYGWFHSGDLGRLEFDAETGNIFCVITGRIKNIIKMGGRGISLDEVDRLLLSLPQIKEAVSCSLPDEIYGEIIGCLVVCKKAVTQNQVLDHLKQYLSLSGLPVKIIFLDQIPRSKNGKVNRARIASTFFSNK